MGAAVTLLDGAIADFNAGGSAPENDFYYGGDSAGWIKAANSIKKKIMLNTGDYAGYSSITDYIDSAAYDFQFTWGSNEATPGFDGPANEEVLECGLPGYFVPPQLQADNQPFCAPTNSVSSPSFGYWGRDHGNDNGIPPDGFLRTLRGVYPAGGTFDDNSFTGQVAGDGLGGVGITPIMLSSWMHFLN